MKEFWSYEKKKRVDTRGKRWHFMSHTVLLEGRAYDDQPYELYFCDDGRTVFGRLRFERRRDNPYRDYALVARKIMEDEQFRGGLLDPTTSRVWRGIV